MTVKRIVPNLGLNTPGESKAFYEEILGLKPVMDQGWIITYASESQTTPQISIASQGGSGTAVPDISIEVEDVDAVYNKMRQAGHEIVYKLCNEPWGVRRFYVRDPAGKVLNIVAHMT